MGAIPPSLPLPAGIGQWASRKPIPLYASRSQRRPFLSTHWSCVLALRDAGADTEARALSGLRKANFAGKADTAASSRIDEIIIHGRIATGSGKVKLAQILDASGNAFMAQEIGTLQINGKTIATKGGVKTPLDRCGKPRVETQR